MAVQTTFTVEHWNDPEIANLTGGELVNVQGYYEAGDGGGGLYQYFETFIGTLTPNGGTIVTSPQATPGSVFILLHHGLVTVRQFGAVGAPNNDGQTLADTVNGYQRFTDADDVRAQYLGYDPDTDPQGRAFELMNDDDTLDWVSIQSCIDSALREGFRILVPKGVYVIRRPLWIGYGEQMEQRFYDVSHDLIRVENQFNHSDTAGFYMEGECLNARLEGDLSNLAATIRLVAVTGSPAFTNRFTLRLPDATGLDNTDTFRIQAMFGDLDETTPIQATHDCSTICTILDDLTDIGTGNIVAVDGTGAETLDSTKLLAFQLDRQINLEENSFHGEFQIRPESYNNDTDWGQEDTTKYVRCLADCGIIVFRGSAQLFHRIANLNLLAIQEDAPVDGTPNNYYASFGVCVSHTTFTGFEMENMFIVGPRWAVGILENNGVNGENSYFRSIRSWYNYGFFYTNAGQALQHTFYKSTGVLNGPLEGGETARYAIQIGNGTEPGYTFAFQDSGFTFLNLTDDDTKYNCVFKLKKWGSKVGGITYSGARTEHMDTFVEWDGTEENQNLQLMCENVTFAGLRGKEGSMHFIKDTEAAGNESLGLSATFKNCQFTPLPSDDQPDNAPPVLIIDGRSSHTFVDFQKCRFDDWAGKMLRIPNYRFQDCLWSDPGGLLNRINLQNYTLSRGVHGQDVPTWIPTGPAQNVLLQSDRLSSSTGTNVAVLSPWELIGSANIPLFHKWDTASSLADHSPTVEAFALQMDVDDVLQQKIDVALNVLPITYQAMVAFEGSWEIELVAGDASDPYANGRVYDHVALYQATGTSAPRIVTLVASGGEDSSERAWLRIRCLDDDKTLRFWWQYAYAGTQPYSPIRTEGSAVVPGTSYKSSWSSFVDEVRITGRLQLPVRPRGFGYASSASIPELRAGDFYVDQQTNCVLAFDGTNSYAVAEIANVHSAANNAVTTWKCDGTGSTSARFVSYAGTLFLGVGFSLPTSPTPPRGKRVTVRRESGSGGVPLSVPDGAGGTMALGAPAQATYFFDGTNWLLEHKS